MVRVVGEVLAGLEWLGGLIVLGMGWLWFGGWGGFLGGGGGAWVWAGGGWGLVRRCGGWGGWGLDADSQSVDGLGSAPFGKVKYHH